MGRVRRLVGATRRAVFVKSRLERFFVILRRRAMGSSVDLIGFSSDLVSVRTVKI